LFFATALRQATAYQIDGSSYSDRSLSTSESGTSDAEARWQGGDGADLEAYAWDANSQCHATARWSYDLGTKSGSLNIEWCFHIKAGFTVISDGLAYCMFWFELWDSSGWVGSSTTKSYSSDIDSDKTISKTFTNLPSNTYTVKVFAVASAATDTNGSSAEADAYYGPLQITSNWLEIT